MVENYKQSEEAKEQNVRELNQKIVDLEAQVNESKITEQNLALDRALDEFTDDEKKYADEDIKAFRDNPLEGNIEAIVSKIYAAIGKELKDKLANKKVSEVNEAKNTEIDIFSEVNSNEENDEDINIF